MEQEDNLGGDNDRISSLPDCVLHLIMAFLTARQAIQLCVLSKRWQYLWTTLPVLCFNSDSEFGLNMDKLQNFVNTYLLLRNGSSPIHTLRLRCPFLLDYPFIETVHSWICYVIEHNIQVLEISCVAKPTTSSLPSFLFTCQSLEELSLSIFRYHQTPNTVNLPRLRRLRLSTMFISPNFMDMILCGCSVLEDLQLESLYGSFGLRIFSQSLKHLVIKKFCRNFDQNPNATIESINTPNLQSFSYSGCAQDLQGNLDWIMPSVGNANIDLCGCFKDRCLESTVLSELSNAQYLNLKGSSIQGLLQNNPTKSPNFHNLRSLWIEHACLSCYFNILASFSEHLPNLGKLSLELTTCHILTRHDRYLTRQCPMPTEFSPFKCKRLQQVEFRFHTYRNDKYQQLLGKVLLDAFGLGKVQIILTPMY